MGSRWLPRVGILVLGTLPLLAFPELNLGMLAWVVLVPVLLLIRSAQTNREAAVRGFLAGFGFLAANEYWLAPNLTFFFPFAVGLLALLWIPWALLTRPLLRNPVTLGRSLLALIAVPAGWVLIETVRSWQWLGGPWSLLGATQWQHPMLLGLAGLGGIWLIGFAIVAANTAVCLLIVGGTPVRCLGLAAAVVAVGAGPLWYATRPAPAGPGSMTVALVQPGIGAVHDDLLGAQERITRSLGTHVDLAVWAESSVSADLPRRPDVLGRLTALSQDIGAPLLVDVDARIGTGDAIAKTSMLVDAHGIRATYQKTRLVPFGEYVPFRNQLGWLSRITAAAGQNRQPGHRLVVMDVDGVRIGPLTSFEETFPDLARHQARAGAQLIVYQSSTATFQGSWAPAQLASFGAVRAAETGRPVVQAALTGVSAAFDAHGRKIGWLAADRHGALVVSVPLAGSATVYDRWGEYVPATCAVIVAATALGLSLLRRPPRGQPADAARPLERQAAT
ncbi:apolipoprotein N-acyltransferase [Rhodococcus sp. D2-41]|uniref:apolipoprotein N-acyltransferase n=1 Tax=Speluncibacter jeojiensis TaxID=2710754 RepID=UPI00240F3C49|nr:apolipoprotein N-acyltransferase [Rhodococcus sp. D2-41]MDG3009445.1 apolipoprotein N-acyltransferase [Rhodococcus sp. D2-41]